MYGKLSENFITQESPFIVGEATTGSGHGAGETHGWPALGVDSDSVANDAAHAFCNYSSFPALDWVKK